MKNKYIEVYDPTGKVEKKKIEITGGIANLNGKIIGLVDNGKPNYDIFLARLEELLGQRFSFSGVVHARKGDKDTGAPLKVADAEKLVKECQVVINGICD
jgi:hypothetical protein